MGARGEVPAAPADAALLAPYLPRAVIRELALEPAAAVRSLPGTLVFADVTGFTRLSERLARIGAEGAEQISDAIGASFATLLEVAYANGGGLLKFGGDALLLHFEGDGHAERACRAAIGMRRALRAAGAIATPGGRTALRMSVGVHSGTLHLFLAGRTHREPVVAGPAVTAVLRMERAARAGDIVVSPEVAALLPARSLGAPAGGGQLLRSAPGERDFAPEEPPAEADAARLALGLPAAVRRHVLGGGRAPEHRLVTVAFVRFAGTDAWIEDRGLDAAAEAIDELVVHVQEAADEHDVALLGSDADVDGGKLMLCAGAPRAAGDEEERMLRTLRAIAERERRLPVQSGVHRGRAFTGDIGPDYRRTYTAMGDIVNVAARLTAKAPAGGVLATPDVLDRSATRFALTRLEPLDVKGKTRPVEAWAVGPALERVRGEEPRSGGGGARRPRGRARRPARVPGRGPARRRALRRARRGAGRRQDPSDRGRAPRGGRAAGPAGDLRGPQRREPLRAVARAAPAARRRGLGGGARLGARAPAPGRRRARARPAPVAAAPGRAVRARRGRHRAGGAARALLPQRAPAPGGGALPGGVAPRAGRAADRARARHGRGVGGPPGGGARGAARASLADRHHPARGDGRLHGAGRTGRRAAAARAAGARRGARPRGAAHGGRAAPALRARARGRALGRQPAVPARPARQRRRRRRSPHGVDRGGGDGADRPARRRTTARWCAAPRCSA